MRTNLSCLSVLPEHNSTVLLIMEKHYTHMPYCNQCICYFAKDSATNVYKCMRLSKLLSHKHNSLLTGPVQMRYIISKWIPRAPSINVLLLWAIYIISSTNFVWEKINHDKSHQKLITSKPFSIH